MTSSGYKRYLLGILLLTLAFSAVDRLALGLLLQDIKADLLLSDTQLGLLTGMGFALFYSMMGIPIARWADRGNRVVIISVTTALWSVAVALSAIATNFAQLLLVRIGVAIGEAGCVPPAHSLLSDHFARADRPRAFGIYMLGGSLSMVIGYLGGGWLNESYGWRMTFVLLGLPGLVLAAVVLLTVREPRLGNDERILEEEEITGSDPRPAPPGLREVVRTLWSIRAFRHLLFFFALGSFFNVGVGQWQPTYFIRTFGMETADLGFSFAIIWGVGGALGTYAGGVWASRYAVNNERRQLVVTAVAYASLGVCSVLLYLSSDLHLALGFMALGVIGAAVASAPLFATIQTLVPERMRAVSVALLYLCANLIGIGLAPLAVGVLSDATHMLMGDRSLRFALLALCPGYLWASWHLWRASATILSDIRAARAANEIHVPGAALKAPNTLSRT